MREREILFLLELDDAFNKLLSLLAKLIYIYIYILPQAHLASQGVEFSASRVESMCEINLCER